MNCKCVNGQFSAISPPLNADPCRNLTTTPKYLSTQLAVEFSFIDNGKCLNSTENTPPVDNMAIYTIVIPVVVGVIVLIVAAVLVMCFVRPVRRVLFPFRDRQFFQSQMLEQRKN